MSDPKDIKKPEIKLPENVPIDFSFERMLKSFLKQVEKDGILKEIKERRYYTKPSEVRHKLIGSIERKKKLERRRKGRK
jgi:ribosomal protein S21